MRIFFISAIGYALAGCGSDTTAPGAATKANGVCVRNDMQGSFCILYTGIPDGNVGAVASGCASSWGGAWTLNGSCPTGTRIGTCTLMGSAQGGADSAVMTVFTPTDPKVAKDDICGTDGTWKAD